MVYLIHNIDQIARQKKKNVIFVKFTPAETAAVKKRLKNIETKRKMVIDWLDKRNIHWEPCFDIFDGAIAELYEGHIHIELSVDKKDQKFLELCRFLENEDETPKFEGVSLLFLRYSDAKKNGKFYKEVMDSED